MEFNNYINQKKSLYRALDFCIKSNGDDYEILINVIKIQKIQESKLEIKEFMELLTQISNNAHREYNFFHKIEQIILIFEEQLKQKFSSIELYDIFKGNKRNLLILFQNNILSVDDYNLHDMLQSKTYMYFFPEIKKYFADEELKKLEKELLDYDPQVFDNYEEKRQEGENESQICCSIRNDNVKDFSFLYSKRNMTPESEIPHSIFETNVFIKPKMTLIEYAAYFGSLKVFRFLQNKGAEMNSLIFQNAVFSNNPKLIHCVEENYEDCSKSDSSFSLVKLAIGSLNNNIVNYLLDNYPEEEKNILEYALQTHNYLYFPENMNVLDYIDVFFKEKYFAIVDLIFNELKKLGTLNDMILIYYFKKK